MSNKYICFKSVIVISLFRLVTTGNRYGISKTDIWTIIPKQSTDKRVFPQTSINQDKQLHHGMTCNSDCSGSFQRRCAVNLTVGITMHAALLRNDFTNVKKKKILTARTDTFDSELYVKPIKKKSRSRATQRLKLKNFPPKGTSIYEVEILRLNNVIVKTLCCYVRL